MTGMFEQAVADGSKKDHRVNFYKGSCHLPHKIDRRFSKEQKGEIPVSRELLAGYASWRLLVHTARLLMEKTEEQERKRNEEEEICRDRDDHRRKSNLHPLNPCTELQHPGMRRVISGSVAMAKPWLHNGSCNCSSQAGIRMRQGQRLHCMQDALA